MSENENQNQQLNNENLSENQDASLTDSQSVDSTEKQPSRKKWKRISLLAFGALLVMVAVVLAYFTTSDVVTNRFTSEDSIYIKLYEPKWDGVDITATLDVDEEDFGINIAAEMQPGIEIPKDPQVYNVSKTAVYVRMKIVLYDESGKEIKATADNAAKISALLSSIYYTSGSGSTATNIQLIPTDYISEDGSITEDTEEASDTDTYTDYNATIQTSNSYAFDYSGGWFYYTSILEQGNYTDPLFDYIDVPITKDEYQYFEDGFSIEVEAQAIDASAITIESGESWENYFKDIVDEFARKYGE